MHGHARPRRRWLYVRTRSTSARTLTHQLLHSHCWWLRRDSNKLLAVNVTGTTFESLEWGLPGDNSAGGGVTGSPTFWLKGGAAATVNSSEMVVVGSQDGHAYALDLTACVAAGSASPITAPCLMWSANLGVPVAASVRATLQGVPTGLLLVSTASVSNDSLGSLYGLDVDTGTPLWPQPFSAVVSEMGQNESYGLHGVPAVDEVRSVAYVMYGPRVAAIDLATGELRGEAVGEPEDPFTSSPVLNSDCSMLYVRSFEGYLIGYELGGTNSGAVTLTPKFACSYHYNSTVAEWSDDCFEMAERTSAVWRTATGTEQRELTWFNPEHNEVGYYDYQTSRAGRSLQDDMLQLDAPVAMQPGDVGLVLVQGPSLTDNHRATLIAKPTDGTLVEAWENTGDRSWPGLGSVEYSYSWAGPAVDSNGNVYVAGNGKVHGNTSSPLFFAMNPTVQPQFIRELGGITDLVGARGPVVAEDALNGRARVYQATDKNLLVLQEGCPTAAPGEQCSGVGTCDCKTGVCSCPGCTGGDDCSKDKDCWNGECVGTQLTGQCECDPCYVQDAQGICTIARACDSGEVCIMGVCQCPLCMSGFQCKTPTDCSGHGTCSLLEGGCICDEGYRMSKDVSECEPCPACTAGPGCLIVNMCGGNGVCDQATNQCHCDPGWTGADCLQESSGQQGNPGKPSGPPGGAIAAGIIISVLVLGAVGAIVVYKRRNPGRSLVDGLPTGLRMWVRSLPSPGEAWHSVSRGTSRLVNSVANRGGTTYLRQSNPASSPAGYGATPNSTPATRDLSSVGGARPSPSAPAAPGSAYGDL